MLRATRACRCKRKRHLHLSSDTRDENDQCFRVGPGTVRGTGVFYSSPGPLAASSEAKLDDRGAGLVSDAAKAPDTSVATSAARRPPSSLPPAPLFLSRLGARVKFAGKSVCEATFSALSACGGPRLAFASLSSAVGSAKRAGSQRSVDHQKAMLTALSASECEIESREIESREIESREIEAAVVASRLDASGRSQPFAPASVCSSALRPTRGTIEDVELALALALSRATARRAQDAEKMEKARRRLLFQDEESIFIDTAGHSTTSVRNEPLSFCFQQKRPFALQTLGDPRKWIPTPPNAIPSRLAFLSAKERECEVDHKCVQTSACLYSADQEARDATYRSPPPNSLGSRDRCTPCERAAMPEKEPWRCPHHIDLPSARDLCSIACSYPNMCAAVNIHMPMPLAQLVCAYITFAVEMEFEEVGETSDFFYLAFRRVSPVDGTLSARFALRARRDIFLSLGECTLRHFFGSTHAWFEGEREDELERSAARTLEQNELPVYKMWAGNGRRVIGRHESLVVHNADAIPKVRVCDRCVNAEKDKEDAFRKNPKICFKEASWTNTFCVVS